MHCIDCQFETNVALRKSIFSSDDIRDRDNYHEEYTDQVSTHQIMLSLTLRGFG